MWNTVPVSPHVNSGTCIELISICKITRSKIKVVIIYTAEVPFIGLLPSNTNTILISEDIQCYTIRGTPCWSPVRTLSFHCPGCGFNPHPGWGTNILQTQQCRQKKVKCYCWVPTPQLLFFLSFTGYSSLSIFPY